MRTIPATIDWFDREDASEDNPTPGDSPILMWAAHYEDAQYGVFDPLSADLFDFTHWAFMPTPEEALLDLDETNDPEFAAMPDTTRETVGVARTLRECV